MVVQKLKLLQYTLLICPIGFLVFTTSHTYAQIYSSTEPSLLFEQYHESKPDSGRVQLLLQLSSFYILKRGAAGKNLDSALLLAKQARELSDHLKHLKSKDDASLLIGLVYIKRDSDDKINELLRTLDTTAQIAVMLEMIRYNTVILGLRSSKAATLMLFANRSLNLSQSLRSPQLIAQSYLQLSNLYYELKDYAKGKSFFLKTLTEERKMGNIEGEAEIFSQVTGNLMVDESLLEELLISRKRLMSSYPKIKLKETSSQIQHMIVMGHDQLSYYYLYKGNLNKALFYSLEMVKMLEDDHNIMLNEYPYQTIGKIYLDLGKLEQSIEYFQTANAIVSRKHDVLDGSALKNMTKAYIGLNRPQEALSVLKANIKRGSYEDDNNLRVIAESMGNCYFAMKQYDKAEKFYLESLRRSSKNGYRPRLTAYVPLAKLYVMTRQYEKARPYLDELTQDSNRAIVPVFVQRDNQLLLFQIDSASGALSSAIRHFRLHKILNDSIFNDKRNSQIEELKLQYDADKKDKDLKLKEQNIQLLTRQSELQAAVLLRTRLARNAFISGMIILFIMLGMVYTRYRFKQKTNKLLQLKQDEINKHNQTLRHLNQEQQKLLLEKEWLVREIHHRVKNNLQMIISLLNAQSEFLEHPSALNAIMESRERMQAIALIHQKLNRPDQGTLINVNSYIQELVAYLYNSFATAERITFNLNVENIHLDVSQSVPLGLILNEAITNVAKYAFKNDQKGKVTIELYHIDETDILLKIADTGQGFPKDFDPAESNSLGIQLIKLFAEQLEGSLRFNSDKGVEISLTFKQQHSTNKFPSFKNVHQPDGENINS